MDDSVSGCHRLFTYGTLKRGGKLHGILKNAKFVGPTTIKGSLWMQDGSWYPAATEGPNTIHGELYDHISPHLMARLDAAEGCPFLFKREMVKTGAGQEAWVYFYARPLRSAKLVESGVFEVIRHSLSRSARSAPR